LRALHSDSFSNLLSNLGQTEATLQYCINLGNRLKIKFSKILPITTLSLLSFVDCNKQSVVTFMLDPDMHFEIKKVPENLKLRLVLREIKDPFV
jgi:hypothetical protein